MKSLRTLLTGYELKEELTPEEVSEFERRYDVVLPADFRTFLLQVANGGTFGRASDLFSLGDVPEHWKYVHSYRDRLGRAFPLNEEWVWEDEEDHPDLEGRVDAVDDGVLLLGEEGCGARWVLVVRGLQQGTVWLTTGEGATPAAPSFSDWLMRLVNDGFDWWSQLPAEWGPRRRIWFAAHAIKQSVVSSIERTGPPTGQFSQTTPLCQDCREFLSRIAIHHATSFSVKVPRAVWYFSSDGTKSKEATESS